MYKMAKNAIDKGSRDNWTIHPKRIEAAREAIEAAQAGASRGAENIGPRGGRGGGFGRGGAPVAIYNDVLHDPKMRDPRGFILPSDQPDFLTATKFVNIADQGRRRRAPRDRAVHGRRQAVSGRLVRREGGAAVPRAPDGHVRAAGSSRRHPVSGRRAAAAVRRHRLQHRLLDGDQVRSHPRRRSTARSRRFPDLAPVPPGKVAAAPAGGGYLLSHEVNDAFVAVNRLLKANEEVFWLKSPATRQRQDLSGRHDVHPGEGDDAADPAEAGGRQGADASTRWRRRPRATR